MWKLRIHRADGKDEVVSLPPGRTVKFGSGPKADIRIEGEGIRDVHFGLVPQGDQWAVVAAKSVRFVKYNGKLVQRAVLAPGGLLSLGEVSIEILGPSSSQEKNSSADSQEGAESSSALEELQPLEPLESLTPLDSTDALPTLEPAHALDSLPDLDQPDLEEDAATGLSPLDSLADVASLDEVAGDPFAQPTPAASGLAPTPTAKPSPRGLPRRVRWALVMLTWLVLFALPPVVIGLWPTRVATPDQALRQLEKKDWDRLATEAERFLRENGRSPYRAEVAAWKQLATWQQDYSQRGVTDAWVASLERELARAESAFWEPAVQRALSELLQQAAKGALEEAWAEFRRRRLARSRETLGRTEKLLAILSQSVVPIYREDFDLSRRAIEVAQLRQQIEGAQEGSRVREAIREAARDGGWAAALRKRDALAASYPSFARESTFRPVLEEIMRQEAATIHADISEKTLDPLPTESPVRRVFHRANTPQARLTVLGGVFDGPIVLADRKGKIVAAVERGILPLSPAGLSLASGGAAIATASPSGLLCFDGRGDIRWSAQLASMPVDLRSTAEGIVVLTAEGRCHLFDPDTGVSPKRFALPSSPAGPGVLDDGGSVYWVAGRRSVLWALNLKEGNCRAIFSGHAIASVIAPPVLLRDDIVLAERRLDGTTKVQAWQREGGTIRTRGTIDVSLEQIWARSGQTSLAIASNGQLLRLKPQSDENRWSWEVSGVRGERDDRLAPARRQDEWWLYNAHRLRLLRWPGAQRRPAVLGDVQLTGRLLGPPVSTGTGFRYATWLDGDLVLWEVDTSGRVRETDRQTWKSKGRRKSETEKGNRS